MSRAMLVAFITLGLTAAAQSAAAQAPTTPTAPDGAALYKQYCRSCHGVRGKPSQQMSGVYPSLVTLSDSAEQAKLTVEGVVALLTKGNGKEMKPFADRMSKDDIRAVAEFVKTLKAAPPAP